MVVLKGSWSIVFDRDSVLIVQPNLLLPCRNLHKDYSIQRLRHTEHAYYFIIKVGKKTGKDRSYYVPTGSVFNRCRFYFPLPCSASTTFSGFIGSSVRIQMPQDWEKVTLFCRGGMTPPLQEEDLHASIGGRGPSLSILIST